MPKPDEKFVDDVVFVVQTQATDPADYPDNETIEAAVRRALAETKNQEGDLSKWVLTLDEKEIDLDQTFAEADIPDEAELHLTRRKGVGGE